LVLLGEGVHLQLLLGEVYRIAQRLHGPLRHGLCDSQPTAIFPYFQTAVEWDLHEDRQDVVQFAFGRRDLGPYARCGIVGPQPQSGERAPQDEFRSPNSTTPGR
jgi:hypothetical protein